jgi:hypothetical protein
MSTIKKPAVACEFVPTREFVLANVQAAGAPVSQTVPQQLKRPKQAKKRRKAARIPIPEGKTAVYILFK